MSIGQEIWFGPQTDWGKLDATHPPQRNKANHFAGSLTPDDSRPVQRVDIYYSLDPHALTRFWRDAKAVNTGKQWNAACPVMDLGQPIFANVVYEKAAAIRKSLEQEKADRGRLSE